MDVWKDVALLLTASGLGAIVVAVINKIPSRQNVLQINADIITKFSNQVRDLADDVEKERERGDKLEQRVDDLQLEIRRVKNAYNRAMKYIYQKKDPEETIPDFMLDTQDLGKLSKDKKS